MPIPTSCPGNVEKSRMPVRSARKQASGVLAVLPTFGLTRRAALRGVRAHARSVRSARQNGCGFPFDRTQAGFFEHSLPLIA